MRQEQPREGSPQRKPRAGWADAAKAMHAAGDDRLLDEPTPTRFDQKGWTWPSDWLAASLALSLAAANAVHGQTVDPSAAVPDALRGHLRDERFAPVATVGALPAGLRDGLKALFGGSTLDLAEPGAPFQATDVVVTPRRPGRRLIAAGCAADHCLVHYERGGFAHLYYAVVFKVSADGTRVEWGGLMSGPQPELEDVKQALVSGKVLGQSKYW